MRDGAAHSSNWIASSEKYMSLAEILVENIAVWYGQTVSREVFNDYAQTYIEMEKPDWLPMLVHKLICGHYMRREFTRFAKSQGIFIEED